MEALVIISYIISLILSIILTIVAIKSKTKKDAENCIVAWIGSITCGFILGMVFIFVILIFWIEGAFKDLK